MFLDILATIVLPTAIAIVVAVFLGRRPTVSTGDFDSDSIVFAGGVLSALFTVMLAFYVVFAWQVSADLESSADSEAAGLVDAYWQAEVIPTANKDRVQDLLRNYATTVSQVEWRGLAAGHVEPAVAEIVRSLRSELAALPADDSAVGQARQYALRDVRQIDEGHRARIDLATGGRAFNGVLLALSLVGAVLMVAFPLVVGLSGRTANLIVIGAMTAAVGAVVYLAIQLTHPMDGPFGVGPDAFVEALREMQPS